MALYRQPYREFPDRNYRQCRRDLLFADYLFLSGIDLVEIAIQKIDLVVLEAGTCLHGTYRDRAGIGVIFLPAEDEVLMPMGSEDKRNTLSEVSQKVMNDIKGKVKVTTYVNVLHKNSVFMMPVSINADKARFEQYMRFHPEMELEYVYYYGNTRFPSQATSAYGSKDMSIDSLARFICRINGLSKERLLSPEEVSLACR